MSGKGLLIGASGEYNVPFLMSQVQTADYVICVDGGFQIAKRLGIAVDMLIGDFDSYTGSMPDDVCIVELPQCKDNTDMMCAVQQGEKRRLKEFVIFGGVGDRLDHTYANIGVLQYAARQGLDASLISNNQKVSILHIGRFNFDGCIGQTISFFPFGCDVCTVGYTGFKYGSSNTTLSIDDPRGVSNEVVSDIASLIVKDGSVLMISSLDMKKGV